jgi:uncharacterized protein (DUF2336 family)
VEIARSKGEPHLLAISSRWWLKEAVTDALISRRFPSVSRRLVSNPGARVSANGYAIIVTQAASNPELAVEAGIRVRSAGGPAQKLLVSATEAVRTKLLSRAPPHLFEEIRNAIATATASADREMSKVRDFTAAKRFVAQLKEKRAAQRGRARRLCQMETIRRDGSSHWRELSQSTIE